MFLVHSFQRSSIKMRIGFTCDYVTSSNFTTMQASFYCVTFSKNVRYLHVVCHVDILLIVTALGIVHDEIYIFFYESEAWC